MVQSNVFDDTEIAKEILMTTNPRTHKELGRKIKNYDDGKWSKVREQIVFDVCKAKFLQNPKHMVALLNTEGTTLVESSPFDKIWGVGMSSDNPRINDPANWKGLNLLGKVLTELRESFIANA